ncbi:hypothetical protein EJ02DRAFT_418927 [Clathrospora elynae]|uniref:BTB domain-containing protein n=1 Tax=Clathrospora elynae TaxID=706981 RepID=A0A6A5T0U6_9PLEO|nr:hypothetical protein EJ02DRAFT_418927 [Clathrospora elynae]
MPQNNTQDREVPRISRQNTMHATILVGPSKACWTLPLDLLTHASPFFRAALTGNFLEAKTKTVTLPCEDPQIFEFFVHWLYTSRFPALTDAPSLVAEWDPQEPGGETKTHNLVHLHVFCDRYQIRTLRIKTMEELYVHMEDPALNTFLPDLEIVQYAYENLGDDEAPLCRFLVDAQCHWASSQSWGADDTGGWPLGFLTGVLRLYSVFAQGSGGRESYLDACDYHEHGDEGERKACEGVF